MPPKALLPATTQSRNLLHDMPRGGRERMAIVGWIIVFGAVLGWQAFMLVQGPPSPTMSSMLRAFMRPVAGRVLLFGIWLWIGWHLFIRGWGFFLRR
jgi:hypothetical protein